jgi:peptide/nickel transport system permease protein
MMLMSDWLIWGLFFCTVVYGLWARKRPSIRNAWIQILSNPIGMISCIILLCYVSVGLLDSIHIKRNASRVTTALNLMIQPLGQQDEKSYSAPFAIQLYNPSITIDKNNKTSHGFARLQHGGHLIVDATHHIQDILSRIISGFAWGFGSIVLLMIVFVSIIAALRNTNIFELSVSIIKNQTQLAWRSAIITFSIIWILVFIIASLANHYHILGTDKIGHDILYETISSIRTGLLIGTLATMFMLPFALILGMAAGFFRGWVDDVIQYLYTTLSSIPGVLLISASVLVLQVYIANHANLFPSLLQRADARLLALCFILGITSWASLCRLLRAETLKLRQQDYVLASRAMGQHPYKIIFKHIMPNIMHIVLITIVLDFSGLVLAEAVLSYVGVGVDPTTMSWGNMINSSRLELAREPVVWWPLLAALSFMFVLVLSANLFADKVRDAFDPKAH